MVRWDQGRGDMDIADAASANDAGNGQPRFLGIYEITLTDKKI